MILWQGLAVDVHKAKRLARAGHQLMAEYTFTRDILEAKCLELRATCKKVEILFTQRRQALLKFLDLFEDIESISKVIHSCPLQIIPQLVVSGAQLQSNISPRRRPARTSSTISDSWSISLKRNCETRRQNLIKSPFSRKYYNSNF